MARLKTAYREKIPAADNNPAPSVPVDEEPPQPSETTRVEFTNGGDKAEPSVAIVSADEYPQPDEATVALMRQLDHLRASEQAQKDFAAQVAAQRAAQMAAQPPTREQKLAMWKEQGMDPEDARFLAENPQMVDLHDVTRVASEAAEQRGSSAAQKPTGRRPRRYSNQHLGQQQAQPAVSARPAVADPAGFFEPPPAPSRSPATERPGAAAYVSAPVSRREPGGPRELSPRQVKLSPLEQEMARNLGLTDTAYAEGKLRMLRAKANGELQ